MKYLLFLSILLILIFNVSSVTVSNGTILNTSASNSSITFSSNFTIENITLEEDSVLLQGLTKNNLSGTYNCDNLNHTQENTNIDSSVFTCSLQISVSENNEGGSTSSSTSSGGSGSYINLVSDEKGKIKLRVFIIKGESESMKFNSKNSSLLGIELKSSETISGYLNFQETKETLEECEMPLEYNSSLTYSYMLFNYTFSLEGLSKTKIVASINKKWKEENNITNILAISCNPKDPLIGIKKVEENAFFENYELKSESFSKLALLGTFEKPKKEEQIDRGLDYKDSNKNKFYLYGVLIIILLTAIIILVMKGKRRQHLYK